jgi:hypothetical protein
MENFVELANKPKGEGFKKLRLHRVQNFLVQEENLFMETSEFNINFNFFLLQMVRVVIVAFMVILFL